MRVAAGGRRSRGAGRVDIPSILRRVSAYALDVLGVVRERALERLERHRDVDQAIGVHETEAEAQGAQHVRVVLEARTCDQRVGSPFAMGCNDAGFVDNAMLESEVDLSFFGSLGEKDLTGSIASVTSYKTAQAVFAPVGSAKGLSKVFDAGAVPNRAFAARLAPVRKVGVFANPEPVRVDSKME